MNPTFQLSEDLTSLAMDNVLRSRALEAGTRQAPVFGVGIGFIVFTLIVICLRIFARLMKTKAVGVDDVLMTLGAILSIALSIASMIAAWYGVGKHVDDISMTDMVPMQKAVYATRVLYVAALMFVKMSLLWFFLRLDPRRYMRWAVYALMFFVLGLSVPSIFVLILNCQPPSKFWDITGTAPGKCMDPVALQHFYDANGILNIVTDVVIFIIPIPMLWRIQISARKKAAVFAVFSLGVLSIAAGCVRYTYVRMLAGAKDTSYYLADSLNWCAIESYVAIFCGSAPALSSLARTYLPRIFGTTYIAGGNYPSHQLNSFADRSKSRTKDAWKSGKSTDRRGAPNANVIGHSRSEEAIIPPRNDKGITITREVHMDVNDWESEDLQAQEDYQNVRRV